MSMFSLLLLIILLIYNCVFDCFNVHSIPCSSVINERNEREIVFKNVCNAVEFIDKSDGRIKPHEARVQAEHMKTNNTRINNQYKLHKYILLIKIINQLNKY
jgi:hypothetical protein